MPYQHYYSISIPKHLIEDIAEDIATRVTLGLQQQITSQLSIPSQPILDREESFQPTFIRLKHLTKRTGLSQSSIYRKISEGKFPRPVALGARSVAWRRADRKLWESNPTRYSNLRSK